VEYATRQIAKTCDTNMPLQALAFSPDGKWMAGSQGNQIRLWDADGNFIADWEGPEEFITTLAFSADSATLASGSVHGLSVWLWRVADGEPILLIPDALEGCSIETLAFHPDNKTLAVGGIDWMATGGSNGASVYGTWRIAVKSPPSSKARPRLPSIRVATCWPRRPRSLDLSLGSPRATHFAGIAWP